jgi:transposase-like protein
VTEIEERGGEAAAGQAAEQDVELAIARGLLERAERGVSLVGPEALLAGVTRSVSQAALDAETTDYLGLCERPATCTCGRESPERDVRQDRADRGRPDPAFIPRDRRGEFQPQIIP